VVINVVKFHEEASRLRRNTMRRGPDVAADIPGLMERFKGLQSKARTELRAAILLLDLAAQQAHQLVRTINDPALKKLLEDDHHIIEELLQLARGKTSRL
jgi:hypothetical protein